MRISIDEFLAVLGFRYGEKNNQNWEALHTKTFETQSKVQKKQTHTPAIEEF